MKIDGTPYRSVWVDQEDGWTIRIFDQTKLPWTLEILRLSTVAQAAHAIRTMQTRGAPLIGAVAAYGLCLALREDPSRQAMERDAAMLKATRPTAVNLAWAIDRMLAVLREEVKSLVRVSKITEPEAALLSPEQSFFVRENFKLRILNARLGLMARQIGPARADVANAKESLMRYFAPQSRKTQTAAALLQQVQTKMRTLDVPRVDETLAALSTAAAGR